MTNVREAQVCTCDGALAFCPAGLLLKLGSFLASFELVFGDADWPVTRDNLNSKYLIHEGGTFIDPGPHDESNNWANRGALLTAYRNLLVEIQKPRISFAVCSGEECPYRRGRLQ